MFSPAPFDKTQTTADGRSLPIAFVYVDIAYYFDMDAYSDAKSTIAAPKGRLAIEGQQANDMLVEAILDYDENKGDAWIASWFKDCVALTIKEG